MNIDLLLAICAVIFAGILRGFSGFGAGMVLVPALSVLYSPTIAVISVAIMELIPALQLLPKALPQCHWRSVIPMSLAGILAIPLGSLLLIHVNEESMRLLISALVLMGVFLLASGWHYTGTNNSVKGSLITGIISGVVGGATGLGGIPIIMYYLSGQYAAATSRSSIVCFLSITVTMSLLTYLYHGLVSIEILLRCLLFAPLFVIAVWIGSRLFGKVSEATFRTVVLTILGIIGLATSLA